VNSSFAARSAEKDERALTGAERLSQPQIGAQRQAAEHSGGTIVGEEQPQQQPDANVTGKN
jgi:hypothetical protein